MSDIDPAERAKFKHFTVRVNECDYSVRGFSIYHALRETSNLGQLMDTDTITIKLAEA